MLSLLIKGFESPRGASHYNDKLIIREEKGTVNLADFRAFQRFSSQDISAK